MVLTEYIVEVYNKHSGAFHYQLDCFDNIEDAREEALSHKPQLEPDEEVQITTVHYDEFDKEIGISLERL